MRSKWKSTSLETDFIGKMGLCPQDTNGNQGLESGTAELGGISFGGLSQKIKDQERRRVPSSRLQLVGVGPRVRSVLLEMAAGIPRPWKLKGTKLVESVEGKMRELQKTNCRGRGRLLRKLLIRSKWLDIVLEGMLRGMLQRAEHKPISDKARSRR
jgi:hypothetical protein